MRSIGINIDNRIFGKYHLVQEINGAKVEENDLFNTFLGLWPQLFPWLNRLIQLPNLILVERTESYNLLPYMT